MKKKIVSVLMTGILAATVFAGCGNAVNEGSTASETDTAIENSEAAEPTVEEADGTDAGDAADSGTGEETVISFGIHVADPEAQENVTYNIVQAFNEKYDGQYQVEFEAADTETHKQNMKLMANDGTLPQLFWMDSSEAPEYAAAGYLMDMSGFLSEYASADSALDESVKAAFRSDIQYGLPYQCNVEGFFYNKEIFAGLGINEPVNGTTFEELLAIVNACNDAGYTAIAQGCMNSGYAIWGYLAMLERYGYQEYIYDILAGDEIFNNPDLLACFEKLAALGEAEAYSENMATQEYFDAKELFTSGQAAIFNTGAWDCAELDEKMGDKVGFWWGPTFSDSSYPQEVAMKVPSAPICVSAAVEEDAAVKEAVYKFLEFYYSEEAAIMSYSGSLFPATNYTGIAVGDTQYALKEVMNSIGEGWISPAAQPDLIISPAVQTQLYDSILGVILGNYTPEEALDKMDEQMAY